MPQSRKLASRAKPAASLSLRRPGFSIVVVAILIGCVERPHMVRSPLFPECELPSGYDRAAILERLGRVLDPELDEPLLKLGFIRSLEIHDGHAFVTLRLPTSWCAVNFAYMMAEDIRRALLGVEGIGEVSVRLGDHCAAAEIEAAVNAGKPFAQAFTGEGGDGLAALRGIFLRKGFLSRQERLLRELREAGCSAAAICSLRVGEVMPEAEAFVITRPGAQPLEGGSAETLRRYLERRAELGHDLGSTARLIVDPGGQPLPVERLEAYYRDARTVRVSLEANGAFCRAVLAKRRATAGGVDVQS